MKRDWEDLYERNWPKDPDTGRDMDVHHVIPLADGGPDHVSNIVPMSHKDHIRLHKESGDSKRWQIGEVRYGNDKC